MMMGGKTHCGWETRAVLCKRIARSWSRLSNRRAAGWRSTRDPTKCPAPPGFYLLRVSARCKEMNCLFLALLLCKIWCDMFIYSLVCNRYVKKGYTTLHKTRTAEKPAATLCHLDQRPATLRQPSSQKWPYGLCMGFQTLVYFLCIDFICSKCVSHICTKSSVGSKCHPVTVCGLQFSIWQCSGNFFSCKNK